MSIESTESAPMVYGLKNERAMRRKALPEQEFELIKATGSASPANIPAVPFFSLKEHHFDDVIQPLEVTLHTYDAAEDERVLVEKAPDLFAADEEIEKHHKGITEALSTLQAETESKYTRVSEKIHAEIEVANEMFDDKVKLIEEQLHAAYRALVFDANRLVERYSFERQETVERASADLEYATQERAIDTETIQKMKNEMQKASEFTDAHKDRLMGIAKEIQKLTQEIATLEAELASDKHNLAGLRGSQFNALRRQHELIEEETALHDDLAKATGVQAVTLQRLIDLHPNKIIANDDNLKRSTDAIAEKTILIDRNESQLAEKKEKLAIEHSKLTSETGAPIQDLTEHVNSMEARIEVLHEIVEGTIAPNFVPPRSLRSSLEIRQSDNLIHRAIESYTDDKEIPFLNRPIPPALRSNEDDESTIGDAVEQHAQIVETHADMRKFAVPFGSAAFKLMDDGIGVTQLVAGKMLSRGKEIVFSRIHKDEETNSQD